jgi:hypothetical protein
MILRTELRRSAAPVVGTGFLVGAIGLLYALSGPWRKGTASWDEEWTGLAMWTRYLASFLWPLVLGASAWQGLRDRRSRMTELLATVPTPAWRRAVPPAGALVLALTGAYVLLLVFGGVRVATSTTYFHLKWLPIAGVMVLALAAIGLLGYAAGRLVPSLLTPPVLAVAGLAAQIALLQRGWPLMLTPTFEASDVSLFTTVAPAVTLTQALWFTGLAATGFALAVAHGVRRRLLALLPTALAAAVTLPVLSSVDALMVADADASALVCDNDGPRVCVLRAHDSELAAFVGPAREALVLLAKLPSPPTAAVEAVPAYDYRRPPAGVVPVFLSGNKYGIGSITDPADIRANVLAGAGTPMCDYTDEDWEFVVRQAVARTVAAGWFTGSPRRLPGYRFEWDTEQDLIQSTWRTFRALPEAEQLERIVALRAAALECDGDLLAILAAP